MQLPLFPVTPRSSDADNTLSFADGLSIVYDSAEFELGTGEAASAMSVKVSGDDLNKLCFLKDSTVERRSLSARNKISRATAGP